ncbi:carbonic anhydrase [Chryseomicrobium sp. FSL W7-1435]|uniref:Carbonic anhydrase n=1 Tax=Chryseomicrobium palamuruense TaxID=682973 RepID=A0ABV8UWI8_9BACL|nr:carbonic anhydrase [Chryseomicrobium aureum]MBM7707330.1 carbonic anhydrase [Chryseomicrobium aureum]
MFADKIFNNQQIENEPISTNPDNRKKVLCIVGMEEPLEQWLNSASHFLPEQIMVLKSYGPVISEPYDSLMRNIIIAVYQENVEEIFVIGSADRNESISDPSNLISKVIQTKIPAVKIQTVEYLFKHCFPGFTANDMAQWIEGSKTVTDGIKQSVNLIRRHPLMPSEIRVYGLLIDTVNGVSTRVVDHQ